MPLEIGRSLTLKGRAHEIVFYPDSEMQDAIAELRQAETMFNNAQNNFRIDEADLRIQVAKKRIEAIRHERGDLFVEKVVREA